MQTSDRPGGTVIKFVAIAVILTGLLLGGIYAVKHFTNGGGGEKTNSPTHQPAQDTPVALPGGDTNNSQDKPIEKTQGDTSSQPRVDDSANAQQLPHTGPAQTLLSVVALGAVVMVGAYYVQSRRALGFRL